MAMGSLSGKATEATPWMKAAAMRMHIGPKAQFGSGADFHNNLAPLCHTGTYGANVAAVLGKGTGRQLEAYMHHDAVEWRLPTSDDVPLRVVRSNPIPRLTFAVMRVGHAPPVRVKVPSNATSAEFFAHLADRVGLERVDEVTDCHGIQIINVTDIDENELLMVRGGNDRMSTTLGPNPISRRRLASGNPLGGRAGPRVTQQDQFVAEGAGMPPSPFMRRQFVAQSEQQSFSHSRHNVSQGYNLTTMEDIEQLAAEQKARQQGLAMPRNPGFTYADPDARRRGLYTARRH